MAPFRAATAVELSVALERGSRSQLRVTASPRGDLHRFQSLQPGGTVATAAAIATSRAVQRGCLIVTTGITPIAPEGHYGVGSTAMRVVITPLAVAIDVLCIPVFIVGGVLLLAGSSH